MSSDPSESFVSQEIRIISSIKSARAALGWTQPELAQRAGISKVALARLEAGLASPRLSTLTKIKAALEAGGVRIADDYPPGGYTLTVFTEGLVPQRADGKAVGGSEGSKSEKKASKTKR
ncbi:helix-turn-helix domain-containing protein [Ectothiorhodospira variabilis]|uniref:helix-turn-helix domain-containing protein n=2 Tax=Ectothiorhodospira variabilis TaxID=505694 RepID=UPI001EFB6C4C|nr:helix-turn-helix domain-containing protein [Ectothiorhodospira variabilis]MCG5504567.1 helix-turn-helix domain-containing protein [Ectothiorhodospira variabilis]MCG5507725.1 helix-turn-helix domain-containing protein [Ectothiorhodospira variabilis]